jgi:hypothetical protein
MSLPRPKKGQKMNLNFLIDKNTLINSKKGKTKRRKSMFLKINK